MDNVRRSVPRRQEKKRVRYSLESLEVRRLLSAVQSDIHDQQVFYNANLENGIAGWTIDNNGVDGIAGTADDGLWHLTTKRGNDPGHSGTHSFYYGNDRTGNYDTGGVSSGVLISPSISLPQVASGEKIDLSFNYLLSIPDVDPFALPAEYTEATFGVITGATSVPLGTSTLVKPGLVNTGGKFLSASADLTAYAGQTVKIEFYMTTSGVAEQSEGWYLDDLSVSRAQPALWTVGTKTISQIDAASGGLQHSYALPSTELPDINLNYLATLTSDGTNLFYTAPVQASFLGTLPRDVLEIDPTTGAVIRDIPQFGVATAIAADGANNSLYGVLYAPNYDGVSADSQLIQYNLGTSQQTTTQITAGPGTTLPDAVINDVPFSVALSPLNGNLYVGFDDLDSSNLSATIVEINPATAQVVGSFDSPVPTITGMAFAHGGLYLTDGPIDTVTEVDATSLSPIRDFSSANYEEASGIASAPDLPTNNNSYSSATELATTPYVQQSLSITAGDVDWFHLIPPADGTLNISLALGDPNSNGVLDSSEKLTVQVWQNPATDKNPLATGSLNPTTRTLTISGLPTTGSAPLYIVVKGASATAQNTYTLTIHNDDADEPNNTSSTATNLGQLSTFQLNNLSAYPGSDGWFKFQAPASAGTFAATVTIADGNGNNALDPQETLAATLMTDANHDGVPDTIVQTGHVQGFDLVMDPVTAAPNQIFWLHIGAPGGVAAGYGFTIEHHNAYDDSRQTPGVDTSLGGPVDVSSDPTTDQAEMQMAIDPTDPNHIVIVSHSLYYDANNAPRAYMDEFRSFDGGSTWDRVRLQTRPFQLGDQLLPPTDPDVAFDRYGNLYIVYHYHAGTYSPSFGVLARSTDGGSTFTYTQFGTVAQGFDYERITIAIGPDAQKPAQDDVYLTGVGDYVPNPGSTVYLWASPAANAHGVLPLNLSTQTAVSDPGNFNDEKQFASVAVGLQGQVYVSWWETPVVDLQPSANGDIRFDVDPDGLGPLGFGTDQIVTTTSLGFATYTPFQPERGIGTIPFMAVDRSNGPSRGRVYIAYTDFAADQYSQQSIDYQVDLVFTDNPEAAGGATWTQPQQVDLPQVSTEGVDYLTQGAFLSNVSVDPMTGNVAVVYYNVDTVQNGFDPGTYGVETYVARIDPDGNFIGDDLFASGYSTQVQRTPPASDFLLYNAVAFYNNTVYAAWSDNSSNLSDEEIYFNKEEDQSTNLDKLPGANPDGTVSNVTLPNLTLNPGDNEWYSFDSDVPQARINLDITLADRNHNGKLDPQEKLVAYLYDDGQLLNDYTSTDPSYVYTTKPDANGNFHLLVSFNNFETSDGTVPQHYELEIYGGPDPLQVGFPRQGSGDTTGYEDGPGNTVAYNSYGISVQIPTPALVYGDVNGTPTADSIVLVRDAKNPNLLDFFLNDPSRSKPYEQFDLRTTQDILINGAFGSAAAGIYNEDLPDTITLDYSNGAFVAPGSSNIPQLWVYSNGTDENNNPVPDSLYIVGQSINASMNYDANGDVEYSYDDLAFTAGASKGITQRVNVFSPPTTDIVDQTPGSLSVRIFDRPIGEQYDSYQNYDYSLDVGVGASSLPGYNEVTSDFYFLYDFYDDDGNPTVDRYDEPGSLNYNFNNKTSLQVDASDDAPPAEKDSLPGATNFNLTLAKPAQKLQSATLIASTSSTGDSITATGNTPLVLVDTKAKRIDGIAGGTPSLPIYYQNIDVLNLTAGTAKNLTVSGASSYTVTPSPTDPSAGDITAGALDIAYTGWTDSTSFLLLGSNASLQVNGDSSGQTFSINSLGAIQVGNMPAIYTLGISGISLTGGDGDDTFNLAANVLNSYQSININGGAGNNALSITGLDSRTVVSSSYVNDGSLKVSFVNISGVTLNGSAGLLAITYQAPSGVHQAILLAETKTPDVETLSISGATPLLINLNSFAVLSIDGSVADEDTLTVQGSDAADTVNVNLSAAGTPNTPVLQMQNGSKSMFSLQNYSGFSQLNLNTLGGNDAITVNLTKGGPSRNLVVDAGPGTDALNIFYTGIPVLVQNPTLGSITFAYATSNYSVQYLGVENLSVEKS